MKIMMGWLGVAFAIMSVEVIKIQHGLCVWIFSQLYLLFQYLERRLRWTFSHSVFSCQYGHAHMSSENVGGRTILPPPPPKYCTLLAELHTYIRRALQYKIPVSRRAKCTILVCPPHPDHTHPESPEVIITISWEPIPAREQDTTLHLSMHNIYCSADSCDWNESHRVLTPSAGLKNQEPTCLLSVHNDVLKVCMNTVSNISK